ncbi:MAG: sensor domain-containing diguanylate cyclase [Myxococcota bacterium]
MDPGVALEALLSLTERLTEELPLEEALRAVTDAGLVLLPANHTSVRILDDTRSELLCGARSGEGESHDPLAFRRGQGVAGWVVEHERVAMVNDVSTDPRFEARPEQGFVVGSILGIPLWSAGQVVGVLSASSGEQGAFDDQAVLLARLLANCASPAFEKARLERLAVTDPNTQAFNRRYLFPRIEHEIARSRNHERVFSLAVMDLDHFKRVNDRYGHPVGDRVLAEFADRVRHTTRDSDELVRWGGEEFVLIMPGTDSERAHRIAERIRAEVAASPFAVASREIAQTVSIGLATWHRDEAPERLVERADAAMYAAKSAGRNQVKLA